jgi:hypothetical protein
MLDQYSTASAGHNIKSVGLPPRKISSFFGRSRMTWDWRRREYTAPSVNTVKSFLLGRQAVRLTRGWRSTSDISV